MMSRLPRCGRSSWPSSVAAAASAPSGRTSTGSDAGATSRRQRRCRERATGRARPGRARGSGGGARSDDVVLDMGHPGTRRGGQHRAHGARWVPFPMGGGCGPGRRVRRLRGAPSRARGGRRALRRRRGAATARGAAGVGWGPPARPPVEALIGLSVALVAVENVWLRGERTFVVPWTAAVALGLLAIAAAAGWGRVPAPALGGVALFALCYFGLLGRVDRPEALRWAVAFLFGLVHGFGFAAVLMEARLPTVRLVPALFGFNAGVELGQLGVVALVWPAIRVVQVRRALYGAVIETGSAAVLALGLFWFVSRAYG